MKIVEKSNGELGIERSAFEKAVSIGASWDWVTPVWTWIQNYRNRPAVGFNVPLTCGWSAFEIQQFMKRRSIKTWGWMVVGDTILFSGKQAQYWLICKALGEFGCYYTHGKLKKGATGKSPQKAAWTSRITAEKRKPVGATAKRKPTRASVTRRQRGWW